MNDKTSTTARAKYPSNAKVTRMLRVARAAGLDVQWLRISANGDVEMSAIAIDRMANQLDEFAAAEARGEI